MNNDTIKKLRGNLWNAIAGNRQVTSQTLKSPALRTPGGRRRFLRLQSRINDTLARVDQLSDELAEGELTPRRGDRIKKMLQHQQRLADRFLGRFDRMLLGDHKRHDRRIAA